MPVIRSRKTYLHRILAASAYVTPLTSCPVQSHYAARARACSLACLFAYRIQCIGDRSHKLNPPPSCGGPAQSPTRNFDRLPLARWPPTAACPTGRPCPSFRPIMKWLHVCLTNKSLVNVTPVLYTIGIYGRPSYIGN